MQAASAGLVCGLQSCPVAGEKLLCRVSAGQVSLPAARDSDSLAAAVVAAHLQHVSQCRTGTACGLALTQGLLVSPNAADLLPAIVWLVGRQTNLQHQLQCSAVVMSAEGPQQGDAEAHSSDCSKPVFRQLPGKQGSCKEERTTQGPKTACKHAPATRPTSGCADVSKADECLPWCC